MEAIVSSIVKAIHKPVTVKIRKGFDENSVNAVEIAKIAEVSGASAVATMGGQGSSITTEKLTGLLYGRSKKLFIYLL